MVVASPLVLSCSSQGWDSSTGLENWTFPRCRRADNTWNTIREFFRTGTGHSQHSCTKRSQCGSLMCNSWRQTEIHTFCSDRVFWLCSLMWSWGPSREEQQLCRFQGFIPAAIPPRDTLPTPWAASCCPCWGADLENIALRGVADAQVEHCPSGHLEAVLWKAKQCSWKSQAHKQGQAAHPVQLEWAVEGGSWMLFGEIPHTSWRTNPLVFWFFLPLSGEAHAKTRQFLNKATERQMCQARTSCFKPGDWF